MNSQATPRYEQAEKFLQASLERQALNHAYLLLGPKGVGKRQLVNKFIMKLYCVRGTGCGQCLPCQQVGNGSLADIWQVAPLPDKQEITIDQVRELQVFLSLGSLSGSWRVVVIEAAQALNAEAANALLKSLEEPAPKVVFFLLSAEPKKVLPTIRSRCFVLHLPLIAKSKVQELLLAAGASQAQADVLAQLAAGRPELALRLLAQPEIYEKELASARLLLGLSSQDGFAAFSRWLETELKETAEESKQVRQRAIDLLAVWRKLGRDLLCLKLDLPELILYASLVEAMKPLAQRSLAEILRLNQAIAQAQGAVLANAHLRLTLEWLAYAITIKENKLK